MTQTALDPSKHSSTIGQPDANYGQKYDFPIKPQHQKQEQKEKLKLKQHQHQYQAKSTRVDPSMENQLQDDDDDDEQDQNSTTNKSLALNSCKHESDTSGPVGMVDSFDHVTFWVGNAKHSANFYMTQFGFEPYAFRGLESGSRNLACHAIKLNETIIQFVSAVEPNNSQHSDFLMSHGDAIKDVAFRVTNIECLLEHVLDAGAELVSPIETFAFDELAKLQQEPSTTCAATKDGQEGCSSVAKYLLRRATIKTFGDVTHTFIERNYEYQQPGTFLPGYRKPALQLSPMLRKLEPVKILRPDHIVGQFPPNKLDEISEWYSRVLNFTRYWSVDEKQIFTEHSGVKSHVVTNHNELVKMPLCEVTLSKNAKSKAEEFVRYNNGSGIHHIALLTDDIVSVVSNMRDRGMEFLNTPDAYYEQLKDRLKDCPVTIEQDIEKLRELKILVDFDEQGYLLQIFTRPVQDRPTLVFEFIQRFNHDGFGAGNFLALFKAIEAETAIRGNL